MKIGVFGAGYVGLVSAVCLAELGNEVFVIEKESGKIEKLRSGTSTIYEPGLNELMNKNIGEGRLFFTTEPQDVVKECKVLFLCVGTPPRENGSADLSQIESAIKDIINNSADNYKLVVVKSTVPVGTASWLKKIIRLYSRNRASNIEIASNPEFLREGSAVKDFFNPDRIVLGVESEIASKLLKSLYKSHSCPLIITNSNTAEIIKYASNSFLATKISFINMVADLCDELNADVAQVAEAMGYDERIGSKFLRAGIGFGGSCFPKDLKAFSYIGREHHLDFTLLDEVVRINNKRPYRMVDRLKQVLWLLNGKSIGVLGLTFKPDTDDVRETPAAPLIEALLREGANVSVFDPVGMDNFKYMFPAVSQRVRFAENEMDLVSNSHALILVTDWDQFKQLDWEDVKSRMLLPIVLDTRNMLDEKYMVSCGYEYLRIGKMHNLSGNKQEKE